MTICGVAGTGKTLLALAGALEQKNRYDQITCAADGGAEQGFGLSARRCRGKVNPYMQPLYDNLNFIKGQFGPNERKYRAIEEMRQEAKSKSHPRLHRGRSLSNVVFIVDRPKI